MPLAQALNAEPSMLHSKPGTDSLALKANVAVADPTVPLGPELIVTTGATESTTQLAVATAPLLPAWSNANTWKVWLPCASVPVPNGLVQAAKTDPSSEHFVPVAPSAGGEKNAIEALVALVCAGGGVVMLTPGPVTSMVQPNRAVTLRLPAPSTARTLNTWVPSLSEL